MDKRYTELVTNIMKRQSALEAIKSSWNVQYVDLDNYSMPSPNYFNNSRPAQGQKDTYLMFDSTTPLAMNRLSSAMASMITPRTQRWHGLTTKLPSLKNNFNVQLYLQQVCDILFDVRYNPLANFEAQINSVYDSLVKYGTGCLFIDDIVGIGVRYKAIHLAELYIAENGYGIVDTVYRKFQISAQRSINIWGDDAPSECIKVCESGNPDQLYTFIHAVYPNEEYDVRMLDERGKRYKSCYVCSDTGELVSESGYREFPYAVARWKTNPNETYGRSPAMALLPETKMANEIRKTNLRAGHLATNPPILVPEDGLMSMFQMQPGAINKGGIDQMGNPRAIPFNTGVNLNIGEGMLDQSRQTINDGFLVTLFQILVDSPQMTATEAMLRAEEKGALLAPTMGRQQAELIGPMIAREIDILSMSGVFPPMPQELIDAGGDYEIEYTSPINRIQRSGEGVAILRAFEAIGGMAQFDPSVLTIINTREAARKICDIYGVPDSVLNSPEQVAELDAQEAQQQQLQQVLSAAQPLANAAKTAVETEKLARQGGASTIATGM